jgi:hypothetical protein
MPEIGYDREGMIYFLNFEGKKYGEFPSYFEAKEFVDKLLGEYWFCSSCGWQELAENVYCSDCDTHRFGGPDMSNPFIGDLTFEERLEILKINL